MGVVKKAPSSFPLYIAAVEGLKDYITEYILRKVAYFTPSYMYITITVSSGECYN